MRYLHAACFTCALALAARRAATAELFFADALVLLAGLRGGREEGGAD